MRIVSGYAEKVGSEKNPGEPRRMIDIFDVDRRTVLHVDPETKTYSRKPLTAFDYDNRLVSRIARKGTEHALKISEMSLRRQEHARVLLGVPCEHWRLRVLFALTDTAGSPHRARLDQDVWVAPLMGPLSKTLLDLITFENAYRSAVGGEMTPLDYERYRLPEAAAFLQVSSWDLRSAIIRAREKLKNLPGYPVGSSVAWWSSDAQAVPDPPAPNPGPTPAPANPENIRSRQARGNAHNFYRTSFRSGTLRPSDVPSYARPAIRVDAPPSRTENIPKFRVIDWRNSERKINHLYALTRTHSGSSGFPMGPLAPKRRQELQRAARSEEAVYPRFESELRGVLETLLKVQEPSRGRDARTSISKKSPFYEVYAELHGLESSTQLSPEDFRPPAGYVERR